MRKIRSTLLISSLVTFLGLVGCASNTSKSDDNGFNLAELESLVKVNETTYADLRKLFRTPTVTGITLDGETVVAFSFSSDSRGAQALTGLATLGIVRASAPYTLKVAYFKLDKKGTVIDIKKKGFSYLLNDRYNKCEVDLTDAEINSPVNYTSTDEVCSRYKSEIAKRKGIDPKNVDDDEEFFRCDDKCQIIRGAKKLYGQFRRFKGDFAWESGDGDRAGETRILHNR